MNQQNQIREEINRWLKNHAQSPFRMIGVDSDTGGYDFIIGAGQPQSEQVPWKLYIDEESAKPVV